MNNSNPTLKKAYKILKRTVKKIGNSDLYFSAQLGIDSSHGNSSVTYAAMIAPPRDGLAPITFAALDKKDFIDSLQNFLDNKVSESEVEIAFHEAQISANNRSIEYHNEQINKIKNPKIETEELETNQETIEE